MRYVLLLVTGLILGVLARWAWPEPLSRKPEHVANVLREIQAMQRGSPPVANGQDAEIAETGGTPLEGDPRVDVILRQAGLHPATGDIQLSWLHIRARGEWLLESPDYVTLFKRVSSAGVGQAAWPLFRQLGLNPAATQQLQDTLGEMVYVRREIQLLARTMDPAPSGEAINLMIEQSDSRFRNQLRNQLGPLAFAQMETWFAAEPARQQLAGAFTRIAAESTPLTSEQREGLVAVRFAEMQGKPSPPLPGLTPAQAGAYGAWLDDEQAREQLREMMGDSAPPRFGTPLPTPPIYQPAPAASP